MTFIVLISILFAIASSCTTSTEDPDDPCSGNSLGPGLVPCNGVGFRLTDSFPAWSPDGEWIAYSHGSSEPGVSGIYLIDPEGNNKQQFHAGARASAPAWSPEGKWIAFYQGTQIFKKHVETDSLVQLTTEGRSFFSAWSPDGEWIAYNVSVCDGPGTCGIWLMNSDGAEHKNLIDGGSHPDWHPMDDKILFIKNRSKDGITQGNEIWEYDINTIEEHLLSFLERTDHYDTRYLKYSPDGERMVFGSQPYGGSFQLWIMDLDGTQRSQLTQDGGYSADWSPDGDWIVYNNPSYGDGRLWLIRPDGSEKKQLTFENN